MKPLSILSLGYTRDLWEERATNDTQSRLAFYATHLDGYWLVTNTYKRHRLKRSRLEGMELIPTDAWTPLDSFLKMLLLGGRILRTHEVSVIQAQDPILTGLAAWILGRRTGIPVNVCVYGPNVFDDYWVGAHWSHRLLAPVGRWVLRRAASIQVDGLLTARRLRAALGGNVPIHVKPMIPQHFDALLGIRRQDPPGNAVFRLLFVGRLERQKNLGMLAAVFLRSRQELAPYGISLELDVVGTGSERADMESRLAGPVAAGSVRFHGQVSGGDLPAVFAAANALVLTSFFEGFPRVMMEAAAAGIPILTTAVSGSDEAVVDGETGYVTPIEDQGAFCDKLVLLARNPDKACAMGEKGRMHIQSTLAAAADHGEKQLRIWRELAGTAES